MTGTRAGLLVVCVTLVWIFGAETPAQGADEFAESIRSSRTGLSLITNAWGPRFEWDRDVRSLIGDEAFSVGNLELKDESWRASLGLCLTRKLRSGYGFRLAYQFFSSSSYSDEIIWKGVGAEERDRVIQKAPEYSVHSLQFVGRKTIGTFIGTAQWYAGAGLNAFILRMHNDTKILPPFAPGFDQSGDTLTVQWSNDMNIGLTGFPLVGFEANVDKDIELFLEFQMHIGRTFTDTDSDGYEFNGGTAVVSRQSHFSVLDPAIVFGITVYL